jgi:hypothetical protein
MIPPPSQLPPEEGAGLAEGPAGDCLHVTDACHARAESGGGWGPAEAGAPRRLEQLHAASPLASAFSLLALSLEQPGPVQTGVPSFLGASTVAAKAGLSSSSPGSAPA